MSMNERNNWDNREEFEGVDWNWTEILSPACNIRRDKRLDKRIGGKLGF